MRRHFPILSICLAATLFGAVTKGQTTQSLTEPDPLKAIGLMRAELIDSFNKSDIDRLLSHVDPDVIATWQNGEVCHGPDAVRAYYNKMMKTDHPVVARLSINPAVEGRQLNGDWAVSWGNLHDEYVLSDDSRFKLNSNFTATIARRGEVWKVVSFHASVNAFDNPVLGMVAKKTAVWTGAGAGAGGLLLGVVATLVVRRRKNSN
jgi:ketosteroid isomerase-like protein